MKVAVVGATGLVGGELIRLLDERKFELSELVPLASTRSIGSTVECAGRSWPIAELDENSFDGVELAFFAVPADVVRRYVPLAGKAGATVIDCSDALHGEAPLVLPELNSAGGKVLVSPHPLAIMLALALAPFKGRVKRVVCSGYLAVSGVGYRAVRELEAQIKELFNFQEPLISQLPHQIAFNVIPQAGALDGDESSEEQLVASDLRALIGDVDLSLTAVRVPVFYGHSLSLHVEFVDSVSAVEVREVLQQAESIAVESELYPMPVHATGHDDCFVGRIRQAGADCVAMWLVVDNMRKGSALNMVQIAENIR